MRHNQLKKLKTTEQSTGEPSFDIKVDLSTPQTHEHSAAEEPSKAVLKHKIGLQKMQKPLSRKDQKLKKAQDKKDQCKLKKDQETPPAATSKQEESKPHEKKQKHEKIKKDKVPQLPKTIAVQIVYNSAQAHKLVTCLINHYIDDQKLIETITDDLCPLALEWTSAEETFNGTS